MVRNTRKNISGFLSWLGLRICLLIGECLPEPLIGACARFISIIAYQLPIRHKKIALESLNIAYGKHKTAGEIDVIARGCFDYIAKSALELLYLMSRTELLKKRVKLIGKDNLDRALAKGRGVILASAHFGNFPLIALKLGLEGYPVTTVMRPMHYRRVEKIFDQKRKEYGLRTILTQPRRDCVRATLNSLRRNQVVFMLIDQNFGSGSGVYVDFFGKKAATATGPAILARRTRAAIVPCFILRRGHNSHEAIFEPEMPFPAGAVEQPREIFGIIQRLTDIIELYIRRYPMEWAWIHRRWKSRPG